MIWFLDLEYSIQMHLEIPLFFCMDFRKHQYHGSQYSTALKIQITESLPTTREVTVHLQDQNQHQNTQLNS